MAFGELTFDEVGLIRPLPCREKLLLEMHGVDLRGIMLTVEKDDLLVLGGSVRRMPYGRRLAERKPGHLSG